LSALLHIQTHLCGKLIISHSLSEKLRDRQTVKENFTKIQYKWLSDQRYNGSIYRIERETLLMIHLQERIMVTSEIEKRHPKTPHSHDNISISPDGPTREAQSIGREITEVVLMSILCSFFKKRVSFPPATLILATSQEVLAKL
jgi:hypothetical protein